MEESAKISDLATNRKKTVVLKEFRRISWLITVYNRENVQVTNRSVLLRNIGFMIIQTVCLIMFGLVFISSIWFCFDCNFNVKELSFAIPIMICSLQMISSYVSIVKNNWKIAELIDYLQMAIDKRKIFFRNFHFWNAFYNSLIFSFVTGQQNYGRIEKKHAFITAAYYNAILSFITITNIAAGMQPIIYMIFGIPTPNNWEIPLHLQ